MDSKRLQIKKALTALLEKTTTANGYKHDLAGKVWRGRYRIDDGDTPCLLLVDVIPEEPDYAGHSTSKSTWEVGIKGYAGSEVVHPTDPAENLLADIKKALFPMLDDGGAAGAGPDFMLGGLVADAKIDSGVVFPPDENIDVACCVVKVAFEIVEKPENPYG